MIRVTIPLSQQNKGREILGLIAELCNQEPSFINVLKELFDNNKSEDQILQELNDRFA